jgi:hypothetical protein
MATRAVLDNQINAAFRSLMLSDQSNGLAARTWGDNYGQVLRDGGRPSDQPNDGPTIPAPLKHDAWVNVYTAPNGRGFEIVVEADEGGTLYQKTLRSHEGGDFVESDWEEITPIGI